VSPSLSPGETIETSRVERVHDLVLADVDYYLTPRASLTFSGAQGWLQFLGPGYINSTDFNGHAGFNYALNPKDSLAIIYTYTQDHFNGEGSNTMFQGDSVQGSFGRKVTGRTAFQIAAGPQYLILHLGPESTQKWSWNASAALTYQLRRTRYGLQYSYATSTGSGVFAGAQTHNINASIDRTFTRYWSGSLSAGYAISDSLVSTPGVADRFDTVFSNANLSRQVGNYVLMNLSYGFSEQTSYGGVCPVLNCGLNFARQVGSLAVTWHIRPINFE
jgi:hypothetical protein